MAMTRGRVLMTADTVGGVWSYCLTLAAGLTARGVATTLAVIGPPPSAAQAKAASAIPGLRLEHCDRRLEWMPGAAADFAASAAWLRALADEADLVHLNGFAHAALDWGRPCLVVAHSSVHSWWQAVHGSAPPGAYAWYGEAVRSGLKRAGLLLAPTAAFRDALAACHGRLPPSRVVYNGADSTRPATASNKVRLVLAAGRVWDPAKNLALLDAAAATIDAPVVIAGEHCGPDGRPTALRHAQGLGFLGAAELRRAMARAAVFAAPARYEPFGLAILEAALAGCALVLGELASLRELWDGAAIFVDPNDAAGLAAAINGCLNDGARRQALARAASERAQAFPSERMVEDTLAAYRGLGFEVPALGPLAA